MGSLRIVHAVRSDAFAGVERYVLTLASAEAARGHAVTVIGGDGTRMSSQLTATGVAWRPATTVAEVARAARAERGADVLHTHMTAAEIGALVAFPLGGPAVVTTRHLAAGRGSGTAARLVGALAAQRIDRQIAISEYVAERVEGESVVIHPGVTTIDMPESEDQPERVVLVVQRLEREKRTDVAVRAWASSGLADAGWTLRVVGDGSQRAAVAALAGQLGVSGSIEMLGTRSDVRDLMARAAMLLAPCPIDGFGLSVVEAMAMGLPVVASAGGGHRETVGRVDGAALYAADDSAAAGRLLSDLAADRDRRLAYGAALSEVQRKLFTVDRQVDATLDVYRAALR